jgi:hypothetical protein
MVARRIAWIVAALVLSSPAGAQQATAVAHSI